MRGRFFLPPFFGVCEGEFIGGIIFMPQKLHYVLEVLRIFIWREAIFEWTKLFEHLINLMELKKKYNTKIKIPITVCPRSLDPFNTVNYFT